jgi:hypothetical protein
MIHRGRLYMAFPSALYCLPGGRCPVLIGLRRVGRTLWLALSLSQSFRVPGHSVLLPQRTHHLSGSALRSLLVFAAPIPPSLWSLRSSPSSLANLLLFPTLPTTCAPLFPLSPPCRERFSCVCPELGPPWPLQPVPFPIPPWFEAHLAISCNLENLSPQSSETRTRHSSPSDQARLQETEGIGFPMKRLL